MALIRALQRGSRASEVEAVAAATGIDPKLPRWAADRAFLLFGPDANIRIAAEIVLHKHVYHVLNLVVIFLSLLAVYFTPEASQAVGPVRV